MARSIRAAQKSARPTRRARGPNDEFNPDLQSDADSDVDLAPRSRRTSGKSKRARSPPGDNEDSARPKKRSARVQKRVQKKFQSKEAARQEAFAANLKNRFLNLPGEIRNLVYEFCQENNEITMTHDLLMVDGSFEGDAPGRPLTQISQQVRAEFLKVYTRTTTIRVHLEVLPEYIDTWLPGPASPGNIVIIIDRRRFEPGSTIAHRGYINMDILPLIKLRQQEPEFQFYLYDKTEHVKIPDEDLSEIADRLERVELEVRRWRLQPIVFRKKRGVKADVSWAKHLKDWLGLVWGAGDRSNPGFSVRGYGKA